MSWQWWTRFEMWFETWIISWRNWLWFPTGPGRTHYHHQLEKTGYGFQQALGILRNFPTRKDLFFYDPIFPIFSPLSTPKMKLVIYRHNTEFYLLVFCFAHWRSKALVIKSLIKRINSKHFINWSQVVKFLFSNWIHEKKFKKEMEVQLDLLTLNTSILT